MVLKLKGAVGGGTAPNHQQDVALIQIMLNNTRGPKSYFKDVPMGVFGRDLASNIAQFQEDFNLLKTKLQQQEKGIVRPGGETFKRLRDVFKLNMPDIQIHVSGNVKLTFFVRSKSLSEKPVVPTDKQLRIPPVWAFDLRKFFDKAIVAFSVLKVELIPTGQFQLTLGTTEKFYDYASNKVIVGPSTAFIEYILKKIPLQKWKLKVNSDRTITFSSQVVPFLMGPHTLSEKDHAALKHWGIPTPYKTVTDVYEQQVLSTIVRPWRKLTKKTRNGLYLVPPNAVSTGDKSMALALGKAISGNANFSRGIDAAYSEILRRARSGGTSYPLVLVFVSGEFQVILGVFIQIGILLDPNTEKEYFYFKVSFRLAAAISIGFSAGVDTIDREIAELQNEGLSYGSSFAKEIEVGPLALTFVVKGGRTKMVPDFNWKGLEGIPAGFFGDAEVDVSSNVITLKKSKGNIAGVKPGKLLTLAGDTETGARLARGEKPQREKRDEDAERKNPANSLKGRARRTAKGLSYSILEVDFGPVAVDLFR